MEPRTSITTTTGLESMTALHDLCQRCRDFCSLWDVLERLQTYDRETTSTLPASRLGNLAQLIENRASCHLCKFLLTSLGFRLQFDISSRKDEAVYLQPRRNRGGDMRVGIVVGQEELLRAEEDTFGTPFALEVYKGNLGTLSLS